MASHYISPIPPLYLPYISRQVTVASHDIERLWMSDGIAYHITLPLPLP